jgi:sigma-E factor negative regulatory protein RseB
MRLLNKLSSYSRVLLFLASMVPALAPAANLTAMELIQSMSEAMRNLSYRGNFVYMHDNQLESMSIMHTKNKSGEKERLLSLNGEAREVIRDDKNLTCIWPASRKVVVDFSRKNNFSPIFIPDDIENIGQFYSFELVGKDRIAGQPTAVVQISPKDRFRYGLKFWINQENYLMMKSILVDDNNRAVEQVMFTNLELVSDPADIVFNPVPSIDESFTLVRFHSGDNSGQASSESFWDTHNIPAGFHRKSVLKRHDLASDQYIYQMVYTDGLASLSIFIEKQSPQLKLGKMSMGAVNAYIRLLGDYMVTAIGEVPEVTVKSMAESISYRGK